MFIDGSVIHFWLEREFGPADCDSSARRARVDYPILYDVSSDMSKHVVLVPGHEHPYDSLQLDGSICICTSNASARAARDCGFSVIELHGDEPFPHVYNYLQTLFVRFERLDAQLRAYVDTRAGATMLLQACSAATGCAFTLVDEQYRTICQVSETHVDELGDFPMGGPEASHMSAWSEGAYDESGQIKLEADAVDLFMASRNYQHFRLHRNVFTIPGSGDLLMRNVFVGGALRGMVVSRHNRDSVSVRYVRSVLGYLSSFVERSWSMTGSFGVAPTESDRIRAALVKLLSGGSANQSDIQALLLEGGHDPESHYVIGRIERSFTHEGTEDLDYLARRFEQAWPLTYCFAVDDALFMLADTDQQVQSQGHDFRQKILIAARENLSKVGLSRSFTSFSFLDAARRQAEIALEQGSKTDPTFWFYRFDDYAFGWLIEYGRRGAPIEYVAHPAVFILADYDSLHGSELLYTLATFMRCRYNATKAAAKLFIARSTLLNRLDRIVAMTNLNFDDVDEVLYLGLSLIYTGELLA